MNGYRRCGVPIYTKEYYLVIEKNDPFPFAMMWMELECIMLSQSEEDKYHRISLMCGNSRNETDEHVGSGRREERQAILIDRELRVDGGRGVGDGLDGGWVLRRALVMSTGGCM